MLSGVIRRDFENCLIFTRPGDYRSESWVNERLALLARGDFEEIIKEVVYQILKKYLSAFCDLLEKELVKTYIDE